jgi:hypothetical protein
MPTQRLPDVKLSEKVIERLKNFLEDELRRSITDRKVFEEEWREINELYDKVDIPEKKDYPFEGASHLMLPVIATYTETMYARAHRTIWMRDEAFTAKPLRKEYVEHVRPLRNFMTWAVREELELKSKSQPLFMELFKLGTCVAKTIYEQSDYYEYDEATEEYRERIATWKDYPAVIPVSLVDFYFPMDARTWDEMYWKSHRIRMTWSDLKLREAQGKFKDVDRIKNRRDTSDEMERTRLESLGLSTSDKGLDKFDIHEIWFEFDISPDQTGIASKLVAFFHLESRTLLRIQHNWFPYQLDPFDMCPMVYRENTIYGRGVGHMARVFQRSISATHNQNLDQRTLANSIMFKRKANARIRAPLKVKPGGEAVVDEMDDLDTFVIGRAYTTNIVEEQHTLSFLENRIGWREYQTTEQMSAQPATTTISLMQEKMRRFDMVIDNIREFLSAVMTKVLLLYQKYYPDGKAFMILGEDGLYVEDIIHMRPINFLEGIGIQTTATTSITSKELDRQAKLSVFNLLSQYYVQIEQRFMATQNPQIPPAVKQVLMGIIVGLSEFVLEILEDFDIRIADRLIVNFQQLRELAMQQASEVPLQGSAAFGGLEGSVGATAGAGAPATRNGAAAGRFVG